jgi:hypothetical protein
MDRKNRGIGLIGPDYEPVTRKDLATGLGEVLWWVLEVVLDLVW